MSSLHHEDGASLTAALVLVAWNMPDSPDCVVNFQPMAIVNVIYGWSCDSASCINGQSRAELPSTSEGSCPPRNPMDCGIFLSPSYH